MALNGVEDRIAWCRDWSGMTSFKIAVSWLASRPGGDKRRQGGGVARIVFSRVIVAASAVTNFAELAPALTERLRRWPFGPSCRASAGAGQALLLVRGSSIHRPVAPAAHEAHAGWAR